MYLRYIKIAIDNFELFKSSDEKITQIKSKTNNKLTEEEYYITEQELFEIKKLHDNYYIFTVIFSALSIEAYIYDYGAINLSDTQMKNFYEKIDLLSKWIIIPKIVTGKNFPTESKAFELLSKLIKARNNLVHVKSKPIDYIKVFSDNGHDYLKSINKVYITAKEAIDTLFELDKIMNDLDENYYLCPIIFKDHS